MNPINAMKITFINGHWGGDLYGDMDVGGVPNTCMYVCMYACMYNHTKHANLEYVCACMHGPYTDTHPPIHLPT